MSRTAIVPPWICCKVDEVELSFPSAWRQWPPPPWVPGSHPWAAARLTWSAGGREDVGELRACVVPFPRLSAAQLGQTLTSLPSRGRDATVAELATQLRSWRFCDRQTLRAEAVVGCFGADVPAVDVVADRLARDALGAGRDLLLAVSNILYVLSALWAPGHAEAAATVEECFRRVRFRGRTFTANQCG